MAYYKVLVAVALIYCMVQQGTALKCYQCSSGDDCNDDFTDSNDITKLDSTDCLYCSKEKTIRPDGTHNSVRGCIVKAASHAVAETGCYECDEKSDTNSCKTRTINCYCDSDNCNHSNTILAVPLVLQICGVIIKLALF